MERLPTPARRLQVLRTPDVFAAVLARRPLARGRHFALHRGSPELLLKPATTACQDELSTATEQTCPQPVDEGWWLGLVVPKRHARRAVTRNLIRREARQAIVLAERAGRLPTGIWVLRLHQGFDRAVHVSAASPQLREAVRGQLQTLIDDACTRWRR